MACCEMACCAMACCDDALMTCARDHAIPAVPKDGAVKGPASTTSSPAATARPNDSPPPTQTSVTCGKSSKRRQKISFIPTGVTLNSHSFFFHTATSRKDTKSGCRAVIVNMLLPSRRLTGWTSSLQLRTNSKASNDRRNARLTFFISRRT